MIEEAEMQVWEINCLGKKWQLTRTFLRSSYEPNLRVYLKYLSSAAVNKGHWQLGPCLQYGLLPLVKLHVLLDVGFKQLWLVGGRRGSEASVQSTACLVGQDHQRCHHSAQTQRDSARITRSWAHLPGAILKFPLLLSQRANLAH